MFIVDDQMLALIMRFVYEDNQLDVSDEEFLQRQLTAVQKHVAQYPPEEETKRAMEWVAEHAKKYRKDWQKNIATRDLSHERCPDCPLIANKTSSQCDIHNQWVDLLQCYVDGGVTSLAYVEDALSLLAEHKTRLRHIDSKLNPKAC
ncbi:hypothetical protein MNBD_GAMMA26-795 [hydrothermal vent metagenome]|uniref:Uncharacterized protein n=1 Tax=hydrothermal vent metagenome TaxID=652676 RepID=A0A3B1AXV1_9ZZZZ